ncbi:MAG: zeta toxin family protein [Woeseiaceae bacterium]|nr:zeta toxin family protein [Woeseiaceae bacterium]
MLGDVLLIADKHRKAGAQIVERLDDIDADKVVVAIGGESGSGKSELAHVVARALKDQGRPAKILHIDNYYKIRPQDREAWRKANGMESVGLGEIDWDLLDAHLEAFRAGENAVLPCIDLLTDQIDELHTDFAAISVVIVDGLYPLHVDADMRIFIDLTYRDTKKAQLLRGKEPQNEYRLSVLEREHEVVQGLRPLANYLVTPEFDLVEAG